MEYSHLAISNLSNYFTCIGLGEGPEEPSPELSQDLPKVLYCQSDTGKVTKEKDPTSEIVEVLTRGEAVMVIEKIGNRYRVKLTKGKTGRVSKLRLSDRQPSEPPKSLSHLAKL